MLCIFYHQKNLGKHLKYRYQWSYISVTLSHFTKVRNKTQFCLPRNSVRTGPEKRKEHTYLLQYDSVLSCFTHCGHLTTLNVSRDFGYHCSNDTAPKHEHSGAQFNLEQTAEEFNKYLLQNELMSETYKKPFKFNMKKINSSKTE